MIPAEGVLSAAAAASTPHPLIHYIKLHPYLIEFIQQVRPFYELALHTAGTGTRQYAEQMTLLLACHVLHAPYEMRDCIFMLFLLLYLFLCCCSCCCQWSH